MFTLATRLINRFPWFAAAGGAVAAALAGAGMTFVSQPLANGGFADPSWQSQQALSRLAAASGQSQGMGPVIALVRLDADIDSPDARARVERVAAGLAGDSEVAAVSDYYSTHDPRMVSRDRRSTYLVAALRKGTDDIEAAQHIETKLGADPHVKLGGGPFAEKEISETITADLGRAEAFAFPVLFLLSLWIFRGVVAALMPLLVGGITIVTSLFVLRFINAHVTPMSIYALNLITGMGLGLAIDYSLFMVSRYREELAAGLSPAEAISETVRHAGRTIFFSSLTVAAALASLLLFPLRFLYSMGVGGIVVALLGSVTSLVVLGAVLRLLGPRINALAPRRWQRSAAATGSGFWYRLAHAVMGRPFVFAAAAALVMIGLGLPFPQIRFTSVDVTDLPSNFSARAVDDTLHSSFPSQPRTQLMVVAETSAGNVDGLRSQLQSLKGVTGVQVQPLRADTTLLVVNTDASAYSSTAQELVTSIRALSQEYPVLVGGSSAEFRDLEVSLREHLPAAVLWVVVTTLLLLFLMTGSVILPLKSVVMNVLTLSAAFGILVLVFQDGRLQDLLSYQSQGALEQTQPILLFAIIFGLSTDYAVFLLTRIKEAHDRGAPNREAVAAGLERTGRIVTAAALLFCVAIGAFSTSHIVFIKELGVGTAAGVLLDATVVRALLVPSLMALMGRWNWWAPRPLARLHQVIGWRELPEPAGRPAPV